MEITDIVHRGVPAKKIIFSDFTISCRTFPKRKNRIGFKNAFPGAMP